MFKKIKLKRTGFKKANVKTFFFFLLFSGIVWMLVQFSKDYTRTISIPLSYKNIPLDKSISKNNPEEIRVQVNDKGYAYLYYNLFQPNLNIDLAKAEEINDQLVFFIDSHRSEIEDQLNLNFKNYDFLQDNIVIDFQRKEEKKIPVVSQIKLNYAAGYSAEQVVKLSPDSVTVSGPVNILDTLQEVKTVPLEMKNISNDISGEVQLETKNTAMLNFYRDKVHYEQKVEKFTEGKVQIRVETRNVPEGVNVAIFPKEVLVYYQVNLQDYEKVNASDFKVVVDFNNLHNGADFLIAQIEEKPGFLNNLRLSERKIQFILKK